MNNLQVRTNSKTLPQTDLSKHYQRELAIEHKQSAKELRLMELRRQPDNQPEWNMMDDIDDWNC